ncbi:uncharacterized protein ARMOST_12220 [Armillaria ostoyae]|uniref:Uncharacterized protein n=1 Tax=Armillaria ostoyae TaxID=47428 RepID=A0A284RJA8_ARMOS|nr:uncharacterized protein ARMOST_12220 [Armillaria ostoyae]
MDIPATIIPQEAVIALLWDGWQDSRQTAEHDVGAAVREKPSEDLDTQEVFLRSISSSFLVQLLCIFDFPHFAGLSQIRRDQVRVGAISRSGFTLDILLQDRGIEAEQVYAIPKSACSQEIYIETY